MTAGWEGCCHRRGGSVRLGVATRGARAGGGRGCGGGDGGAVATRRPLGAPLRMTTLLSPRALANMSPAAPASREKGPHACPLTFPIWQRARQKEGAVPLDVTDGGCGLSTQDDRHVRCEVVVGWQS